MTWIPESERERQLLHLPGKFVVTAIAPNGYRYDVVGSEKMGHFELAVAGKAIEHLLKRDGLWEATG